MTKLDKFKTVDAAEKLMLDLMENVAREAHP
jgi:hypothetical protein